MSNVTPPANAGALSDTVNVAVPALSETETSLIDNVGRSSLAIVPVALIGSAVV
jgi:hypothetical protein